MDERGQHPHPVPSNRRPSPRVLIKMPGKAAASCPRSFISCGEPTSRQHAFIYRPPWESVRRRTPATRSPSDFFPFCLPHACFGSFCCGALKMLTAGFIHLWRRMQRAFCCCCFNAAFDVITSGKLATHGGSLTFARFRPNYHSSLFSMDSEQMPDSKQWPH